MSDDAYKLLSLIDTPDDLRKLSKEKLPQVSRELRQFIIDVVSSNPGHFGASLGVVELTVALHYVYNTPHDLIVWDVGHQAYGHKILTGRREKFYTNRKYKGISGFPKPDESKYDSFGVGHSSTSISAALGMAIAARKKDEERHVVAIIGDGAITAGLAYEGLNNAGTQNSDLLVILNDNNIAIDQNVGAIKEYLLDITTSRTYNRIKNDIWQILGKLKLPGSNPRSLIQKLDHGLKSAVLKHSNLFESMNFRYFGPVDGHDVMHLAQVLNDLKNIPGPKLLHCQTVKGKGFEQAELNQTRFHAPGKFNKTTGEILKVNTGKVNPPKYQDVFGHTIIELAEKNKKIVGITPAMPTGSSLNLMMEKMPDRAFDVGIAEQHAVTFSAGLAKQGMTPFCNIYSTFMQRAYDQVIHDVAIQNLNVVFCLDRGGIVGEDGATHQGVFDLAYLRNIPNMTVSAPMNEEELRNLMYSAQKDKMGPFSIRYPRGNGVMSEWKKPFREIPVGKGRLIREGHDIAILSIGHVGNFVVEATEHLKKENISVCHYDMRFVKPLDTEILHRVFKEFESVITIEDGTIIGGFGSAVIEFMAEHQYSSHVKRMGVPDHFIDQGTPGELYHECGFDTNGIFTTAKKFLKRKTISHAG